MVIFIIRCLKNPNVIRLSNNGTNNQSSITIYVIEITCAAPGAIVDFYRFAKKLDSKWKFLRI